MTKILYKISKKSNENQDGYLAQKPLIEEVLAQRIEDFSNLTADSEVAESDFDKKDENGLFSKYWKYQAKKRSDRGSDPPLAVRCDNYQQIPNPLIVGSQEWLKIYFRSQIFDNIFVIVER